LIHCIIYIRILIFIEFRLGGQAIVRIRHHRNQHHQHRVNFYNFFTFRFSYISLFIFWFQFQQSFVAKKGLINEKYFYIAGGIAHAMGKIWSKVIDISICACIAYKLCHLLQIGKNNNNNIHLCTFCVVSYWFCVKKSIVVICIHVSCAHIIRYYALEYTFCWIFWFHCTLSNQRNFILKQNV
jgi:hypothetical protein